MTEFLAGVWEFLSASDSWVGNSGLLIRTWDHVVLSAFATVVATAISLPPGLVLGHQRRGGAVVGAVVNIGRAIPSFGILALALPISLAIGTGIGFWPTFVALVALAMPPIFTNTYTGITEVDPTIREAAFGMGMTHRQVLVRTELPLAMPVIWTALRVAAVQVVATATLGAVVGLGGLGRYVIDGFAQGDDVAVFIGGVSVALLAIGTDVLFGLVERRWTPGSRSPVDLVSPAS